MSFAYSNVVAFVAVVYLPVLGWSRIAPMLSLPMQRYFFALTLWGVPFVVGQFSQQDEWGHRWFQYHLLDLSYAPWGTALTMCLLLIASRRLNKPMTKRMLLVSSFGVIIAFGYVSEVWDTLWAWRAGQTLAMAIDVGDYVTITVGGVATVALYFCFRQPD